MGSASIYARRMSLKKRLSENQLKADQLRDTLKKYSNLSSLIANGVDLSPDSIASVGYELFGTALDIMTNAAYSAQERADKQVSGYVNLFGDLTNEEYASSGLAAQANLFKDENGEINTEYAFQEFYEQALKDYISEQVTPVINQADEEITTELQRIEAEIAMEKSEIESLKQAESEARNEETIKI